MKYNFRVGDAVETFLGLKGRIFYVNSLGEPFIRYNDKSTEQVSIDELTISGLWRFLYIGRYRFEFKKNKPEIPLTLDNGQKYCKEDKRLI